MYAIPFILLYGVPASIISDKFTTRFKGSIRRHMALIFHLFCGTVVPFIMYFLQGLSFQEYWIQWGRLMFIASTLGSLVFWSVEEILRKLVDWESVQRSM